MPYIVGATVMIIISVFLLSNSLWWLILVTPVLLAVLAGMIILAVAMVVVRACTPLQTRAQSKAVTGFVDKLERVADVVGTPPFWLLIRIIRDAIRPQENGYIASVAKDSSSVHKDFMALQRLFS